MSPQDWVTERVRRAIEEVDEAEPEALPAAVEARFAALHVEASRLIGARGFDAITRRALHLARRDAPSAPTLLQPDDAHRLTPADIRAAIELHGAEATREAVSRLLEHVVGLLCEFIGANLTGRMLRRAWPGAARSSGPAPEGSHET